MMTRTEYNERLAEIKDKRYLAMIKDIIKENNINKDIKWTVSRVSNGFHITNDYCDGCDFEIEIVFDEYDDHNLDSENIVITDLHHWDEENNKQYLFQGHDRWSDYENIEVGVSIATKHVVKWFYYYY